MSPTPDSPGSQTHVERLCPTGAELGMPQAAELVPVPLHSWVVLCSAGITGSWAVPTASPMQPAPTSVWGGGLSQVFYGTSECGRDSPCSARFGNCVSFPQSLVQSRKAGITSALASSTLNNEELVGAGLAWGVGGHAGRAVGM